MARRPAAALRRPQRAGVRVAFLSGSRSEAAGVNLEVSNHPVELRKVGLRG